MRLAYAHRENETPANLSPEHQAVYDNIRARRAPRPLIPLDLTLLHNVDIADGYNTLMSALRTKTEFPQDLAELAICYIAVLNGASYEWLAHAPLALRAGTSRAALKKVLAGDSEDRGVLSKDQRLVLEYTLASTRGVRVKADVVDRLRVRFGPKQTLELTMVVAGYNMVSRLLVGLDVGEHNGSEMVMPAET